MLKALRPTGLRVVEKKRPFVLNYISNFSKEQKERIKYYVNNILQTDYRGSVVSVARQKNSNMLLFFGSDKYLLNEVYLSEIS